MTSYVAYISHQYDVMEMAVIRQRNIDENTWISVMKVPHHSLAGL